MDIVDSIKSALERFAGIEIFHSLDVSMWNGLPQRFLSLNGRSDRPTPKLWTAETTPRAAKLAQRSLFSPARADRFP
jgi:hypothetical protein